MRKLLGHREAADGYSRECPGILGPSNANATTTALYHAILVTCLL
jgi:hypothetical protein